MDIKVAFLYGKIQHGVKIYVKTPEGFEYVYPRDVFIVFTENHLPPKTGQCVFLVAIVESLYKYGT